jgi:hypothetical protein
MPSPKDDLKAHLARYRQIKLSVIGRNLRRGIAIPFRFLSPDDHQHLRPRGSTLLAGATAPSDDRSATGVLLYVQRIRLPPRLCWGDCRMVPQSL